MNNEIRMYDPDGLAKAERKAAAMRSYKADGCCGHPEERYVLEGVDIREDGTEVTWTTVRCRLLTRVCKRARITNILRIWWELIRRNKWRQEKSQTSVED